MRAKILIFFMVFHLFELTSDAQTLRFNKIYELDTSAVYNTVFNILPTSDDKYYFTGNNYNNIDIYNSHVFLGVMNDTGKIVQFRKMYIDSTPDYYNQYSLGFRDNFFTTFSAYNTPEKSYDIYLFYINEYLDTVWTKKFELRKNFIAPRKIIFNRNNNIIIVGGYNNGTNAKGFFLEVDTLGSIINLDTNILSMSQTSIRGVVQSKIDNGYICSGISYIGDVGQNFICKLDSSGTIIWSRSLGGSAEDGSLSIEFINDTTFLVSGFRRLVAHGSPYANLIKITESNRVLMDYLPSVPEVSLKEIDKIIKRGNYYYGYGYSQHADDSVVIFCMDTSYNFVWARYYLRDRSPNILYDFRETIDGGFVACGFVLGPLNQDGWVLKLDSLGCDVSNCWIKDTTVDTATIIIPAYSALQNIKIYPNPIRDKFQVEFEAMDFGENYSIEIKNMLGEIIFTRMLDETKSEIDIHSLDAALYFYEIKNKDGVRVACGKLLKE